ncbi:hypothetical protein SAMN05428642_10276 [Flaviramulus basaltis]|uniref:Uncharacterized protein n=1 Tax=Flaviramulus basaltis TaxID=369401 RepID=A0A1K2IGU5_9FLAO|nr:hypothetical protein [Flaviramulus basaltis]SFZ91456.1 hypothetical protein SAMN05428642_10276 [Flaviramulus basaltis]
MIYTPLFIVLLSVVFILVWLFTNTIDKRKWLSFLISLVLTPIVYFYLFYPFLNIFSSYHHEKYFNAETWLKKPSLRYEMSNNIIDENLFAGKTKKDIKNLLGESEWFGWDDSLKANSPQKWNYNLGFKPGALNNMQECIEIVFNTNRVKTIKQYQLEKTFE